jgi:hypothetical protein
MGEDKSPWQIVRQVRTGEIHLGLIRWTRKVAIFTGVLAAFTGLLFIANIVSNFFIYQQWLVTNRQQEDTRTQLRAVVTINTMALAITNDRDGHPVYYSFMPVFSKLRVYKNRYIHCMVWYPLLSRNST